MAKNNVVVVVSAKDDTNAVFTAVQQHLKDTQAHANEAANSMGQFGAMATRTLERLGIVYGIREAIRGMEELVKSSIELGMEIGHLAQQTGISTENLSVLKYAAGQTGVEFETLTKGFKKLSTELFDYEHGSKQAKQAFDALGISQKQLTDTGGDLWKVAELVSDRMSKMPDGFEKNAAATQLFGRAGQELIPLLNRGASALEEYKGEAESLGLVLDSSTVKSLEELHAEVAKMEGSFEGLGLEITKTLAPALEHLAEDATKLMQAFQAGPSNGLKLMLSNALSNISVADSPLRKISDALRSEVQGNINAQTAARTASDDADSRTQSHPKRDFTVTDEAAANKLLEAKKKLEDSKRALAEEAAKTEQARAKAQAEENLAILDSQHKQQLISDADYYTRKVALQENEFRQERAAVEEQQQAIGKQIEEVRSQKPKDAADKLDQQAKVNDLTAKLVATDERLAQLDADRAKANAAIATEIEEATKKAREQADAIAASLEAARGGSAASRIQESQDKYGDERRAAVAGGASPQELAQLDALQKIKEAKLQLAALDEQLAQIQNAAELQILQLQREELEGTISRVAAEKQIQAVRQQERKDIEELEGVYSQYASAAGAEGTEAMHKISSAVEQLDESMQKAKTELGSLLHDFFDPLIDKPKSFAKAFQESVNNVIRDIARLEENKMIESILGIGAGGGGGPQSGVHGDAGLPGGARGRTGGTGVGGVLGGILGIFRKVAPTAIASNGGLATAAGTIPDAVASSLNQGRNGAGGNGGVSVNIINQGTPQQVTSSGSSGGSLEQMVISIMLKDADTLGPVSRAFAGSASQQSS